MHLWASPFDEHSNTFGHVCHAFTTGNLQWPWARQGFQHFRLVVQLPLIVIEGGCHRQDDFTGDRPSWEILFIPMAILTIWTKEHSCKILEGYGLGVDKFQLISCNIDNIIVFSLTP